MEGRHLLVLQQSLQTASGPRDIGTASPAPRDASSICCPPVSSAAHLPVPTIRVRASCDEIDVPHLAACGRTATQASTPSTLGQVYERIRADLPTAQAELDAWVEEYNTRRPHQALDMATPRRGFTATGPPRSPPCGQSSAAQQGQTPVRATGPGSPGARPRSAWSASTGSRSAWAWRPQGRTSTCGSPTRCCSSLMATPCYEPRSAPAPVRSARNGHRSLVEGRIRKRVLPIKRIRTLTHPPK